jgi:hypothetical protein
MRLVHPEMACALAYMGRPTRASLIFFKAKGAPLMFFEKKNQTMCRLHLLKIIILKNHD